MFQQLLYNILNKIKEKHMTYSELMKQLNSIGLAITTMGYDANTIASRNGAKFRNEAIAYLSGEYFKIINNEETYKVLKEAEKTEDEIISMSAKYMLTNLEKIKNIPHDLYVEFETLKGNAQQTWEDAKNKQDYTLFEKDLKKLIELHKKVLRFRNDGLDPYESSLDDYEKGLRKKEVDTFFTAIEDDLLPFIDTVLEKQDEKPSFLSAFVSIEKQNKISQLIMDHLGYEKEWGYLGHAEHPFSSTFSINDSRITSHIHENDFTSNIFSIIHEIGHSMYNHQVNEKFEGHALADNMSMSMHESQSRLLENMIGRSEAFWTPLYSRLQEIIPETLGSVSLKDFILGINYVEKGFIRIEADELTYSLHIMVRYHMENLIFSENISTDKLNEVYAKTMKDYLGVTIHNDSQGILQDVHWSDASFGYFPTYALGTAYGAQFMNQMKKEIPVDELLIKGDMESIFNWLKENIHQYSGMFDTQDMIKKVTHEPFNPNYYTQYLIQKYSELLGIQLDS